ncbi:hypothetical protein EZS27_015918 [termite gut metagenome]|uniref:Uncharacterized protein n=1 Tax=termite gut metagenome TaxID=433724 RepID=A0A5J4RSC5_9ZZZZ
MGHHHHHPQGGCYPVTLEELKNNLRIPECDTSKDEPLLQALYAADEYCRVFTGRDFDDYPPNKFPHLLRYAILISAGSFFKSPLDRVFTLPTQAQHFLKMYQIPCSPHPPKNE